MKVEFSKNMAIKSLRGRCGDHVFQVRNGKTIIMRYTPPRPHELSEDEQEVRDRFKMAARKTKEAMQNSQKKAWFYETWVNSPKSSAKTLRGFIMQWYIKEGC